jgi:hypothetical protein
MVRMKYIKLVGCFILFLLLGLGELSATHLRAGEITVERVSCNGLSFRIKITAYTNTGSPVKFSDGTLNFGDGKTIQTPTVDNTIRPELGAGIGYVEFEILHTFPGAGRYVITYKERNRNAGILNMSNSVNTQFFLETVIIIDPFIGCDNSPKLLVPPIDKGCTGGAWYHNPGAFDPDGDSLSYEFVVPKQDKNIAVSNYRDPNEREFYDRIGLNYSAANETQNGPPTFTIDSQTGTIIWDAPGAPGEYNIAFRVIQWRKIGSVFKQIGYVTRDMQIVIEDCKNKRPELTVPQDVCVVAGTSISETIFGNDDDPTDKLKLEAFSEVFSLNPSPATFTPSPAVFQAPLRPAVLQFNWKTECSHIKDQPYQVVFKVSDQASVGNSTLPSLVQFKTWRITVIGPKPIWKPSTPTTNIATRSVTLDWENYACATNASSMEVWRRVDSNNSTPGPCVTGMPDSFGYTKIKTLPIGTTTYTDPALAPGAKYCYRLVAIFPAPKGGKSIVSDEICVPPFKSNRAIITKVSIKKTNNTLGEIDVEWIPPLDTVFQDPSLLSYQLFRAEGFTGKNKLIAVLPNPITQTSVLDDGLNTRDVIYNYRVLTFYNNSPFKDTSAVASTVRLEIIPKFEELQLKWVASVPWSNNTLTYPFHTVYRGPEGATESQLIQIIPDVNVNQKGFVFNDKGLDNGKTYCYRVETRGSYGNSSNPILTAKEPLTNFSQIFCSRPDDKFPPCKPTFSVDLKGVDCENTILCGDGKTYSNKLTWIEPDPSCKLDIKNYNIYFAAKVGDEFKKLPLTELVTGTEFEHKNLPSFAGCYKISAVDFAGNESELSDAVCFDNCPYYELPNVFTPNGDGCNELFSAFNARNITQGEATNGKPAPIISTCGILSAEQLLELQKKCARFVTKVVFTVYNRWGGVLYTYESGGERTTFIDWNGKDSGGGELASGIYYYEAQVTFNVVDPSKQNRTMKGWVQLLR